MKDIFAVYKKRDPFYFRAGLMLLIAAAFCWAFGLKESYMNFGAGLCLLYILQYIFEKTIFKADITDCNKA